jgi:hypothetical protein
MVAATCGGARGSLFARMEFVVSHPFHKKKWKGWGTVEVVRPLFPNP